MRRWYFRFVSFLLILIFAGLLIASNARPAIGLSSSVIAQASSIPTPVLHTGETINPIFVNMNRSFTASSGEHPKLTRPFYPKDQNEFQRGKERANNSVIWDDRGQVQTVTIDEPQVNAQLESSLGEQVQTDFPVMSFEQQVSLFGADQQVFPPDVQLAAGPTYLLEMVNDSGSVWTKSGTLVASADLNAFFPVPPGYYFTDPRVIYDALSGRWFVSGLSFDSSYDSQVYVGVSTSANPTSSWYFYIVRSNTSGIIYDQPKIGVSSDKVVISWNDYSNSGYDFSGQETCVLQKSAMLSGGSFSSVRFGPDSSRSCIVPSQSLSATNVEYMTYNDDYTGYVGVVAITGTPAQGNVTWNEWDLSMTVTNWPPDAAQPGTSTLIGTNDDRFLSAVWQNGILWTGGNDAGVPPGDSSTRSMLRLVKVSTSGGTPSLIQNFRVGMTGGYLYFPAITMDGAGNAFFAFSGSSSTLFGSAMTTYLPAGVQPSSLGTLLTIRQGTGVYDDGYRRWGDYSSAAPDPADSSAVWVTAEYAASSTDSYDWGTGTAKVVMLSPAPTPTSTPTFVPTAMPPATSTPSPTPVILRNFLPAVLRDFSTEPPPPLPPVDIQVGTNPRGVGVNQNTNKIYVVNLGDDAVSVIDGTSNTVVSTIPVGSHPEGVAVNPTTNKVYVVNLDGCSISVIDGTSNAVYTTISVTDCPGAVAVNSATNKMYSANEGHSTISVIDGASNLIVSTVPMSWFLTGIDVNQVTNRIYISNAVQNNVSVIDGTSNSIVATVSVGNFPTEVAVNPMTNRIYVSNLNSNTVSVIDGDNNTLLSTIPVGNQPRGMAVNQRTNKTFVANFADNTVSVIDGSTNTVSATIPVGNSPWAVGINPFTNRMFVTNSGDNTVSAISP